jgi:hypothetical protein
MKDKPVLEFINTSLHEDDWSHGCGGSHGTTAKVSWNRCRVELKLASDSSPIESLHSTRTVIGLTVGDPLHIRR